MAGSEFLKVGTVSKTPATANLRGAGDLYQSGTGFEQEAAEIKEIRMLARCLPPFYNRLLAAR